MLESQYCLQLNKKKNTLELGEINSQCSQHTFHFSSHKDRDFSLPHGSSDNEKRLLKCDINGLQEALVLRQKNPLPQGY